MKSDVNLTAEQAAAIEAKGKTIVSASAGSGKTFVMIEKICDFLEEGGDLDNLLAITYTNKAAAQMREKLSEKLRKRYAERLRSSEGDDPALARLETQMKKVASADVCTIHALCARLIRTYYYASDIEGIDASFSIAAGDDAVMKTMSEKVLDDLFEEKYEAEDGDFLGLVAAFRHKRSDRRLREAVISGYEAVRNIPDYETELKSYEKIYTKEGFEAVSKRLYKLTLPAVEALLKRIEDFAPTLENVTSDKNRVKYEEIFAEMESNCRYYIESGDVFAHVPAKLKETVKPRDAAEDKEIGGEIKNFLAAVQDEWEKCRVELSDPDWEQEKFILSGKTATALCALISEYDRRLSEEKRSENMLDYGDLEHYALKLLSDGGEIKDQVQERYGHIFVDEFQDVNPVQDAILEKLTESAETVFYVGDVKQAIYGFRGSKSSFFMKKFEEFEKSGDERRSALRLPHNFRSAERVVGAVNEIFCGAMNKKVCDVDYAKDGVMVYGGKYADGARGRAEVDYFERRKSEKKKPEKVYSVMEDVGSSEKTGGRSDQGAAIAAVIDDEINNCKIYDIGSDTERNVRNSDICVLVRKGSNADVLNTVNYLSEHGYPVSGVKSEDVRSQSEICGLIDILRAIDNPEEDEPVCAFLLSPMADFTEDDLAVIRTETSGKGAGSFRERVRLYAETHSDALADKIRAAYQKLEDFRDLSEILGASSLIDRILEDTGWAAKYEKDGGVTMKSVRALQGRAFQAGGEMTLPEFLRYLDGSDSPIEAPDMAAADCVHVMTMHSAKGLEFPVVIIADVARTFEGSDPGKFSVTFDEDLGFAPAWYDTRNMKTGKTILQKTIELFQKREDIKNELNVFYVACTRAMYSLHIMNSKPKEFIPGKALAATDYNTLVDFSNITGYLGAAPEAGKVITHYVGRRLDFAVIDTPAADRVAGSLAADKETLGGDEKTDETLYGLFEENYERPYAHAASVDLPMKSSASVIIHAERDEEPTYEIVKDKSDYTDSDAIERGTAYHKYLEICDFSAKSAEEIGAFLSRVVEPDTRKYLSADNLHRILSMSVFENVPKGCMREKRFLCRMKASDILGADSDDEVLVQGTIDFLAVEGNRARIVDYKFSVRSDEELIETYSPQLKIYRYAVSKILGIPFENISTTIVNIKRLREIPVVL